MALGIADVSNLASGGALLKAAIICTGLLMLTLMLHHTWSVPGALRLVAISGLLLASNPVTEAVEIEIAGDPANYRYASSNEPYVLTQFARRELWAVAHAQELSETVATMLVLYSLLLAAAHHVPGQARRAHK